MKTTKQHILTSMILAGGLLAVSPTARAAAGEADRSNQHDSKQQAEADLRMTRADTLLGRDVMSSDNQKVGDIDDLVFDLGDSTRITHVIVSTGGFLDIGDTKRAVPIDAISRRSGVLHLDVDRQTFNGTKTVGDDRDAFMNDRPAMNELRSTYGLDNRNEGNRSRGGAKTEPVYYSELKRDDVLEKNGDRIGIVTDAWVDVAEGEVAYIEVMATRQSGTLGVLGTTGSDLRYSIPASTYTSSDSVGAHTFDITREDLSAAPSVSEADFLRSSTNRGNVVLRVDASKTNSESTNAESEAGE